MKVRLLAVLFAMMTLTACRERAGNAVVAAGSTSVQPYAEILAEMFQEIHPDIVVDVQGGGSSAGISAAEKGIASLGMSSRGLNALEAHLWSVEIAKDGLAIVVHPNNPVNNLSLEQIRGIYAGEITNWQAVGGNDAKIHLSAREEGSGTRGAFDELIMGGKRVTAKSMVQDSNGAIRQLISGDVNSIGFLSLGLVDNSVKALSIDGVEASRENVINGSYILFRPFLFISETAPEGDALTFVEFILSDYGRQILINEGLIPD